MLSTVGAALTYIVYLLGPGYVFLRIIGSRRYIFLFSYGISFSLLVITQLVAHLLGNSLFTWIILLHSSIAGLIILGYLYSREKKWNSPTRDLSSDFHPYNIGFFLVVTIFGAYHLFVGAYTEIPSDFWKHLARVGSSLEYFRDGIVISPQINFTLDSYFRESSSVYLLHATVAYFIDVNPIDVSTGATLITSSIYLGSVYWFSIHILKDLHISSINKVLIGCLATFFTVVAFGTATFSFVRYYSYFPTIFNFPLLYITILLIIDYLDSPQKRLRILAIVPILLFTMAVVHLQEVLLSLILISGIAIIKAIRSYLPKTTYYSELILRARVLALVCIVSITVVSSYALFFKDVNTWWLTPHIIDLGVFMPGFHNWPIANPAFRFWDTLAIFGVIVYIWYFINWKYLRQIDYLTIGMLSPVFTLLNPIYASIFLHLGSSSSLWRAAYLMPLPIVAAILVVLSASNGLRKRHHHSYIQAFLFIPFIMISLFPFDFHYIKNDNSKLPSLSSVEKTSGAFLWKDLIDEIVKIETITASRQILTDEVTRFILYASTRGQLFWWNAHEYFPKHNSDYKNDFIHSDFTDSLLVINRRNGNITGSAATAGHWPETILDVSSRYPDDLEDFVKVNPGNFELLWEADGITIYRMTSFSLFDSR